VIDLGAFEHDPTELSGGPLGVAEPKNSDVRIPPVRR
jgi:hypothetical protein